MLLQELNTCPPAFTVQEARAARRIVVFFWSAAGIIAAGLQNIDKKPGYPACRRSKEHYD